MNVSDFNLNQFIQQMGLRRIPSPAAGSSLGVAFSMACSLMEMIVSEQVERKTESFPRQPSQDLSQIKRWKEEGLLLAGQDIQAVEKMIHKKGQTHPKEMLAPVSRLLILAEKMMDLIRDYLPVAGPKVSDGWVAFFHLRSVYAGALHIIMFNESTFDWPSSLQELDWEKQLQKWDQQVLDGIREINQ